MKIKNLIFFLFTIFLVSSIFACTNKKVLEDNNEQLGPTGKIVKSLIQNPEKINIKKQVVLATQRKQSLLSLIESDPKTFLRMALPKDIRNQLPLEIQKHVEEEVDLEGDLIILHADDFDNGLSKDSYLLKTNDKKIYQLYFLTKDFIYFPKTKVKVHGIKIDNKLVVIPSKNKNLNIISTDVTQKLHNKNIKNKLMAGGITGKVVSPPLVSSLAIKTENKKVAVILFNFQNDNQNKPFTKEEVHERIFVSSYSPKSFYKEVSYKKFNLTGKYNESGDVYGWYTIPYNNNSCTYEDLLNWTLVAQSFVQAEGLDVSGYDYIINIFPVNFACNWGGLAVVGGNISWIRETLREGTIAHELGHNFGLWHANAYICTNSSGYRVPISSREFCFSKEYSDFFDVMGSSYAHINSFEKSYLGWFNSINKKIITQGGSYNINSIEIPSTNTQSLIIPSYFYLPIIYFDFSSGAYHIENIQYYYYLEHRKYSGFGGIYSGDDVNGTFIRLASAPKYSRRGQFAKGSSQLIDSDPTVELPANNADLETDSAHSVLHIDDTFSDNFNGISITTQKTWLNGTTVRVDFFTPICIRTPPTIFSFFDNWGTAGDALNYSFVVINEDNRICGNSNFTIHSFQLPGGWSQNPEITSLIIPAGGIALVNFTIISADGSPPGSYYFMEEIINTLAPEYNSSFGAFYNVLGTVKIEDLLQNKAYKA